MINRALNALLRDLVQTRDPLTLLQFTPSVFNSNTRLVDAYDWTTNQSSRIPIEILSLGQCRHPAVTSLLPPPLDSRSNSRIFWSISPSWHDYISRGIGMGRLWTLVDDAPLQVSLCWSRARCFDGECTLVCHRSVHHDDNCRNANCNCDAHAHVLLLFDLGLQWMGLVSSAIL